MKTKSVKRMIIILIVLILILGGIFAYLYFATDLLKSNQQLFFKYLGQLVEEDGFFDSNINAYFEKKLNGKYEDSGTISADINVQEFDQDILDKTNDVNIQYSGVIDNVSQKNEQTITINYSDDVSCTIKYKYANDIIGIQHDDFSSKYMGIENNNLNEFLEKAGMPIEGFPDRIDLFSELKNNTNEQGITFTDEEKEQIKNTYQPIFEDKFKDKEFTKTEENGTTSYSVVVTSQEVVDLTKTFLETLKNDQILLPKIEEAIKNEMETINHDTSEEINLQETIQQYIDEIDDSTIEEGNATVTISQTNRELSAISILFEDGTELNITKSNADGMLTYEIEIIANDEEGQNIRIFATFGFQGLETVQSVNEKYQLGMEYTVDGQQQNITYNLESTAAFNDGINIDDFADDEVQILNDYDSETLTAFFQTVGERIVDVNNKYMDEIDFDTAYINPILYAFPTTMSLSSMIYNEGQQAMEDANNSLSSMEITQFNTQFTQYQGSQRGSVINSLLNQVVASNAMYDDRKVTVSGDITMDADATEVPASMINTSSTYMVTFNYNYDTGLVDEIVITEE